MFRLCLLYERTLAVYRIPYDNKQKLCSQLGTAFSSKGCTSLYYWMFFKKNVVDHALIKGTYASRKRVERTQQSLKEQD